MVDVEEHRRAGLLEARRREGAALRLQEGTEGVDLAEGDQDGVLDGLARKVVLLTTHFQINRDGHHVVRSELVRPRRHVASAQRSVPQQQHHVLGGHRRASHPDDGLHARQLLLLVLEAAEVEQRGGHAHVHRLAPPNLVVGLRCRMVALGALDHDVLVDGDAAAVDVEVPLVVEDRAVGGRVRVARRPDVDARPRVLVELGVARLAMH